MYNWKAKQTLFWPENVPLLYQNDPEHSPEAPSTSCAEQPGRRWKWVWRLLMAFLCHKSKLQNSLNSPPFSQALGGQYKRGGNWDWLAQVPTSATQNIIWQGLVQDTETQSTHTLGNLEEQFDSIILCLLNLIKMGAVFYMLFPTLFF